MKVSIKMQNQYHILWTIPKSKGKIAERGKIDTLSEIWFVFTSSSLCSYTTHIVLCFFCIVYPMVPVSLNCPSLIAPSIIPNVYIEIHYHYLSHLSTSTLIKRDEVKLILWHFNIDHIFRCNVALVINLDKICTKIMFSLFKSATN